MKVILCFRQGRFWHYVLKSGYPPFQAGKILALRAKKWLPLFQAGKILALRAKKWLSSVSGREDFGITC